MYVKYNDEDCMISICYDTNEDEALMCMCVIYHECV